MFDMFKVITKNFFSKPTTRLYPVNPERKPFERSRGRIIFNPDNCMLCSLCAKKCPADAITVDRNAGKWELNSFRCIICGECVNSCPKKCITMSNERRHSAAETPIETFHKEIPKPTPRLAAKPAVDVQTAVKVPVQPDDKPAAAAQSADKVSIEAQSANKTTVQAQPAANMQSAVKTPAEAQSATKVSVQAATYKEAAAAKQ